MNIMKTNLLGVALTLFCTATALAQPAATAPAAAGRAGGRPPSPVRDPLAPGYVKATELPDGVVPPMEADGNFIIGPTHAPAPEMSPIQDASLKGDIYKFTMSSTESKLYPGVLDGKTGADADPRGVHANPAPWSRTVSVYVPKQYVPGT